ncbi:condensin complex subunit 1-like [Gigantopelta aegis]|uniref:condensin complex subunit 1-like n=1 Tax=Gigantopelta aegis TaxID=1735272 RepID=UPI001B888172|nr:condensin complex subunit 1-like [Gigantopelta aegis]
MRGGGLGWKNLKMSFEFVIPVSKDDLLRKSNINEYVVDEILPLRLIPSGVQDFRVAAHSNCLAILENFDSLFSVLCLYKDVDSDVKEEVWDILIKACNSLANRLSEVVEGGNLDQCNRVKYLNAVKMTCYLLCSFMEQFEAEQLKPGAFEINMGKKRTKKKKDVLTSGLDWDKERDNGLKAVLNLLHVNLCRLWDPPVAEEEFVSLISNCCYKLLENPGIAKVIQKDTRDSISHILGILIKKYNHALGASLKVMQLLQHFEHTVSPLTQAVELVVIEYGAKSVASEIMREIGRIDPEDLARDASGTRSYSTFLVELAEKIPAVMLSSISVLIGHLDGESYSMRNGVLGAMGEILIRVLSKDNLDDKMKNDRDSFFNRLEDHIHDVNSFVRSKVLQIWLNIVGEKCLPLPRQEHLTNLVLGRLQDKTSQVRKYAIQLMTALLKYNPFAAKLPIQELQMNYETEKQKLQNMMPEAPVPETIDDQMTKFLEEWQAIEKNLLTCIADPSNLANTSVHMEEEETLDSVTTKIYDFLNEGKHVEAIQYFKAAQEAWPESCSSQKTADSEQDKLSQSSDTSMEVDNNGSKDDIPSSGQVGEIILCLKEIFIGNRKISVLTKSVSEETESQGDVVNEVSKQQILVQYLQDSLTFARQVQESVPIVCQLLSSKNTSDVFEAIEFFVTGFEFGVSATIIGIRRILALIWSREVTVKEAVVNAYKKLYLNPQGGNQRSKALAIVKNLSALTRGVTLGELMSLEQLIVELVKSGDIGSSVIQMLWEMFTLKISNTPPEESRGALSLIAMVAGAESDLVCSNIDVLVSEGLGPRAETDYLLAQEACLALNKLGAVIKVRGEVSPKPFKLPESHEAFSRLSHLLVTGVANIENNYWIPLSEQAVNVIYRLSENPDAVCGTIIKKLADVMCKSFTEEEGQGDGNASVSTTSTCILTRLLSMAGHVAVRQLIHLDVDIFGELKRRRAMQDEKKSKHKTKHIKTKKRCHYESAVSDSTEVIEEELGLAGAAAEDAEAEFIRKVCEQEIVTGDNLLSVLTPVLVSVCSNQQKYPDPRLRTAATLALSKFMLVSSEFCESHLPLLFTLLEKSPNLVIRSNAIIALGDLTFRFPNLIEPWTPHLYGRLRDDSPLVRKNTLQVLTRLILNDMVKVKGQISELASCVVDHDDQISNLAKLFFLELSKKGNALYNVMPDIISRLSDPDVGVDEESFQTIMGFLFSFIQKDKQCESLVEKLCHRFRATRIERQWRDLSYCLSMLSYNEKSLRKLQENFACFSDKLHDNRVYSCFTSIVKKSCSFTKPETKTLLDELEERLTQCHTKGAEEDEIAQKASKASDAASHRNKAPRTPARTPGRRKANKENLPCNEESPGPGRRTRKKKTKPKISFSSDEEEEVPVFDVDEGTEMNENEKSDDELFLPLSPVSRSGKKTRDGKVQLGRRHGLSSVQ